MLHAEWIQKKIIYKRWIKCIKMREEKVIFVVSNWLWFGLLDFCEVSRIFGGKCWNENSRIVSYVVEFVIVKLNMITWTECLDNSSKVCYLYEDMSSIPIMFWSFNRSSKYKKYYKMHLIPTKTSNLSPIPHTTLIPHF